MSAGVVYAELSEQFRVMLDRLTQQNPSVAARFAAAVEHPPQIGSVKLSWRDGKLNGIEVVEQSY